MTPARPANMNLPTVPRDGGIQFGILVQPRASRNEISGIQGDRLKVRLTSPPVDGAANKSCLKLLAKSFGVSQNRVTLVNGQSGRKKTIHIEGLDTETFDSLLIPILSSNSNSK